MREAFSLSPSPPPSRSRPFARPLCELGCRRQVTAYDWHSMPATPCAFKCDDTLNSDAQAAAAAAASLGGGAAGGRPNGGSGGGGDDDQYTVFLTTRPTYAPGTNEVDVSGSPTGVCLVRLIYPADEEVARCRPRVDEVPRGERAPSTGNASGL